MRLLRGSETNQSTIGQFDAFEPADEVEAFARLLQGHRDKLYRVALRMSGHQQDAEDLLQDALLEAYRSFKSFRQGTHFDKWLYRIMTNTFIDRQRKKKRVGRTSSLDDTDPTNGRISEIPDSSGDPSQLIENTVFAEALQHALASLPADFRMVLILSDVEEHSYEEISAMMGTPVGTVRSRLHRARSIVRDYLTSRK